MNLLKTSLLPFYRLMTAPARRNLARRFDRDRSWPGAVLFYHRVAHDSLSDWTITAGGFQEHIDWLTRISKIVSLSQVQQGQQIGSRDQLEVAITFDDGYSESAQNAIPLLVERRLPCTFFVSTQFAENGNPFPHDVAINQNHRPASIDDVRSMAAQGIEIGCHTSTHLDLGLAHDRKTLLREIRDSRHQLQDWTGQEVRFFSFPYGMQHNMSQAAIDMIYESGFDGFVSAYGAWNKIPGDSFHIRRFHAFRGLSQLNNWLTLDPRQIYWESTFSYNHPQANQKLHVMQADHRVPVLFPGNSNTIDSSSSSPTK